LRLFSFGGYELALAALALVVFGAYDSYPTKTGSGCIQFSNPDSTLVFFFFLVAVNYALEIILAQVCKVNLFSENFRLSFSNNESLYNGPQGLV